MKKFFCINSNKEELLINEHEEVSMEQPMENFTVLSREQKLCELKNSKYPMDNVYLCIPSLQRSTTRNKALKIAIYFHQNKVLGILLNLRTEIDNLTNASTWNSYQFDLRIRINHSKNKLKTIDYDKALTELPSRFTKAYRDIIHHDQLSIFNCLDSIIIYHENQNPLKNIRNSITDHSRTLTDLSTFKHSSSVSQLVNKAVEHIAIDQDFDIDKINKDFRENLNVSMKLRIEELRTQFNKLTETLDKYNALENCKDDEIYNYIQCAERAAKHVSEAQKFKLQAVYSTFRDDKLFLILLLSNIFDMFNNQ